MTIPTVKSLIFSLFIIIILISLAIFGFFYYKNTNKSNENYIAIGVYPMFTPDSNHIIYLKYSNPLSPNNVDEIHLCNLDGSNDKKIATTGMDWRSKFRNDQDLIFNFYEEINGTSHQKIYSLNINNGQISEITSGYDFSLNQENSKMVYIHRDYNNYKDWTNVTIRIFDFNTKEIIEFNDTGFASSPILTKDNKYIIYTDYNNIIRYDIQKREKILLTEGGGGMYRNVGFELQLSPNGEKILFHRGGEMSTGAYLMNTDGSKIKKIAESCDFAKFHPTKNEVYSRGIEKVDFEGNNQKIIINSKYQWTFSFNSDGSKIVYSARKIRDSLDYYIFISDTSD